FLTDRPLADPLHEPLHDLEVDVGLEQGDAHFAEGLLNVLLGQAAGSTEAVEDAFEALRQGFEHRATSGLRCGGSAESTLDYRRVWGAQGKGPADGGGREAGARPPSRQRGPTSSRTRLPC